MRIQGAVLGVVLVGLLVGCADADPTVAPSETSTPTPVAVVAPVGESALPLGCADLLASADVAELGAEFDDDLSLSIDENRIVVSMGVRELQLGTLQCIWAARYGSTDFHASVEVTVAPSTATTLDPTAEQSHAGEFTAVDGEPSMLVACSDGYQADETATLYLNCDVIQLHRGYRIELRSSGLRAPASQDASVVRSLVAKVAAAIDLAEPTRVVEPVDGTSDPASLCRAPEIVPLLERLGAEGDPVVEPSPEYRGVTRCTWSGQDEYGDVGPWVSVLPGGAWAIPRLGAGVSSIFMPTRPSADGSFVIGVGDGVSAWRAVGNDLVLVESGDFDAAEGWEAFLEATW
jgi:hypothetical protein